jgi:hypothetical protein
MLHAELSCSSEMRQRFIGHSGAASILDDDVAEDGAVFLVMDLVQGPTRAVRTTNHGRPALALGAALLIASIVWVGRMRPPEIARSAQAVLVSVGQPAGASDPFGTPPAPNVANADDIDGLLPLERDGSASRPFSAKNRTGVGSAARTHGGRIARSLPKVPSQPTVDELAVLDTSPANPIDLARRGPLLADLLDRRK